MDDAQLKYERKLKHLKRLIRQAVFENAALCDECVGVTEKLNKVCFSICEMYQWYYAVAFACLITSELRKARGRLPHFLSEFAQDSSVCQSVCVSVDFLFVSFF